VKEPSSYFNQLSAVRVIIVFYLSLSHVLHLSYVVLFLQVYSLI